MRRLKLGSESGRIWAGTGGVLLMVAGAVMIAMMAFSADSPAGKVSVAQADHATLTEEEIEALPNGTKIVICHTEGNGSQHEIEVASEALLNAGHFDAPGNPLHAVGSVHDFIISVEGEGVINDVDCGAVATNTPTATQPVATATSAITPEPTATNTSVPPTNTPTATQPVATATSALTPEATNTPTNTPEATTTSVPPTNTPESTATPTETAPAVTVVSESVQATPTATTPPLPPAAPLDATQAPPAVLGVQATPPPSVRILPSTGSGGYEENSTLLIVGAILILAGASVSLVAVKRRVE